MPISPSRHRQFRPGMRKPAVFRYSAAACSPLAVTRHPPGHRGAVWPAARTKSPSHLPWLGIDPLDALEHALQAGMIGHVQAKDIQIDERARTRYGVFGKTAGRASPTDVGWWRYRVPGRGQLDWNKIIDALYSAGYDGDAAVEHEDPVWGGTTGKILQGMQIAASTLLPLITTEPDAEPPAPRP